jgi:hypothetical protein
MDALGSEPRLRLARDRLGDLDAVDIEPAFGEDLEGIAGAAPDVERPASMRAVA